MHGGETPEPPGVGGHHGGTCGGRFRDVPGPTWLLQVPCAGSIPRVSLAGISHESLVAPTPPATAPPGISTPGTSLLRQVRDLSAHVRCPWIPHGGGSAADYRCGDAGLLLPEVDLSVRQGPGSLPV